MWPKLRGVAADSFLSYEKTALKQNLCWTLTMIGFCITFFKKSITVKMSKSNKDKMPPFPLLVTSFGSPVAA